MAGSNDVGSMKGRTVVMTGATSGIGLVAAQQLATRGARLVIVGRDAGRIDAALRQIRARNTDVEPAGHQADLSRLAEMTRVAAAIRQAEPRIDVLCNNAGAVFDARHETEDGLELTFAVNHLAYVVMALGLRPSLEAAGAARVVNTSSAAHRGARYRPEAARGPEPFSGWRAYSHSKLCNILFTRELARRWSGTGITSNCLHPGFVDTRFGDSASGWLGSLLRIGKAAFAISPEKGADTLVHLAAAPEVAGVSGRYFARSREASTTRAAQDDAAAAALWDQSVALAGLAA